MSMNMDIDISLLNDKMYRDARNIRNGVSSDNNLGTAEAIMGNTVKQDLSPYVTIVGRYADLKTNAIYLFLYQTYQPHSSIYRYNVLTDTVDSILLDEELNFSVDHRINHIDLVEDTLYWTDKYNPPRKLNVVKAYNYTNNVAVSPLERYFLHKSRTTERMIHILDQIMHPPLYPPTKFNGTDSGITFLDGYGSDISYPYNLVHNSLWQFRYRYIYDEHQKSVWSPCSNVFYDNITELGNGIFMSNQTVNNVIGVSLDTGSEEVNHIEIAVRTNRVGKWKLIERIYKYDSDGNVLIASEISHVYKFYNNVRGEDLNQIEVNRDFHLVPLKAAAQTVIEKNRLVYGNILEGYDEVTPDVNLDIKTYQKFDDIFFIDIPCYLYGMYLDWRVDLPNQVYVNGVYSITINRIGSEDNWNAYTVCEEGDTPLDVKNKLMAALEALDYIYLGSYTIKTSITVTTVVGLPYSFIFRVNKNPFFNENATGIIYLKKLNYPTFKAGSWQEFGLRYFDVAGRACSVATDESCKLFIPYYPTLIGNKRMSAYSTPLHQIYIDWEINNIPPFFAHTYRWYRKKSSIEYFYDLYLPEENVKIVGIKSYLILNPLIHEITNLWKNSTLEEYVWQKGDRIRFYGYYDKKTMKSHYVTTEFDFEIVGMDFTIYETNDNGYLKDDLGDFIYDDFGNKTKDSSKQSLVVQYLKLPFAKTEDDSIIYFVEIYRQKKELADDDSQFWYEFSEAFPVLNPETTIRSHGMGADDGSGWARDQNSVLSARGTFMGGDVYLKIRNAFDLAWPVESQWYSDFFISDLNDDGKVSTINKEYRQKWFPTLLRYGGLYIQESFINELTAVIGGDLEILSEKFGEINLIKESGYTLRVRCSNKIVSIYIGRAGLQQASVDAQGGQLLVASDRILGTQYIMDDAFGCLNPESEVGHGNDDYFVDIFKGHIIRESKNGLLSLSKLFGAHNWTKATCDYLYNECQDVRIVGGFSEDYDELYFSFYGINKITKVVFAETIMFYDPERAESKGFKAYVDLKDIDGYPPDWYVSMGKKFFTLLKGKIVLQDSNSLICNFYGVQYYPNMTVIFNKEINKEKVFKVISYDGEGEWECPQSTDVLVPASYDNVEMQSKLPISRFKSIKGIKYAPFGNNMLSTTTKPTIKDYVNGNALRGNLISINLVGRNTSKSFLRLLKVHSITSELTG